MGFRWEVRLFSKDWLEVKDWARDVLDHINDMTQIKQFKMINDNKEISVCLDSGVIFIEETTIHLGANLGGYGYKLSESVIELVKIAPFTSAVYNITNKNSKDLEKHLYLKYKIISILDKVSGKLSKLDVPIEREYLIYLKDSGITIC